jgi:hypothetical protein
MKSTKSIFVAVFAVLTAALPVQLGAQHTRYKLIDLGNEEFFRTWAASEEAW